MKIKDRPEKIRTPIEELEFLDRLKESVEWAIVKRVAQRYIGNLRRIAFNVPATDPNGSIKQAELQGEARGIKKLIEVVDNSGKKIEEREKVG
jgi:hypothetical protein